MTTTTTPAYPYNTADLAAEFGLTRPTIRAKAAKLGIGIDLEGRAGFRYSEADRQKLIDSMKPAPTVQRRRRRRAA